MATAVTNEHDLEELLQKITDPSSESTDELAVHLFCSAVKNDSILIKKSTELIVTKIKSTNVIQSRKAIELLEECMAKCGSEFQTTIARFQFLNELIRLVSKKFAGDDTPSEIRNKILDCLSLWTAQYPERTKIKEAYDTLLRSGVQHEVTPTVAPSCKRTDFIDEENEKLLKKLLSSNNREDFLRANLLIKYLVKQDAKKSELSSRQRLELQAARNSATILGQFIDRWTKNGRVTDEEVAKDIFNICKKSKQIVMRMPEIIEDDEQLLGDAIEVNDILLCVLEKYEKLTSGDQMLQPVATPNEISADLMSTPENTKLDVSKTSTSNPLDELTELFSQNFAPKGLDLLEPVPINVTIMNSKESYATTSAGVIESSNTVCNTRMLPTIDKLSDELFMENLNSTDRAGTFKREPNKIPIKDLLKDKTKMNHENNSPTVNAIEVDNVISNDKSEAEKRPDAFADISASLLDSMLSAKNSSNQIDSLLKDLSETDDKLKLTNSSEIKDVPDPLLDALISVNSTPALILDPKNESHQQETVEQVSDDVDIIKITEEVVEPTSTSQKKVKHLSEINVELNTIRPSNERPRIVMDDIQGLRVTLNFALDRPSPNVSVIVISTINQSSLPITNYQFDASVKKPCKVRLLPPTNSCLPGVKPFRPPIEDIQQILLLFNPTQTAADLTCIIGYQQGDDPDPIKESVTVKEIPYCE